MEHPNDPLYVKVFKVNEKFYELVYEDPWLKEVFKIVDQEIITRQQSDFIVGALGGEKRYCGRNPKDAHPHIFVDEEMWQLREYYLRQAFEFHQIEEEVQKKWIAIDDAFKKMIIKNSPSDCEKRYFTDEIIAVPSPKTKKSA